jgi:hypothetical protein
MPQFSGSCHCGSVTLEIELSAPAARFTPRACDCEFCRKHGACYVSDPAGSLLLRLRAEQHLGRYRQGSGSAEMLLCRNCGVLVGAVHRDEQCLRGVVNVNALSAPIEFAAALPVSPKSLTAQQKVQRWRELWFPEVRITADT